MSVMKDLKEATWDIHARTQKKLGVKRLLSDLNCYCDHIARLEAFHNVAEAQWSFLLEGMLSDFPKRRKTDLLANDLETLGGPRINCAAVPTPADTASALGAFYVLEGSTLGGRHLLPIVEEKLGLSGKRGASYLASYGSEVEAMWTQFSLTVETHCAAKEKRYSAIKAARATFLVMEEWLCREEGLAVC